MHTTQIWQFWLLSDGSVAVKMLSCFVFSHISCSLVIKLQDYVVFNSSSTFKTSNKTKSSKWKMILSLSLLSPSLSLLFKVFFWRPAIVTWQPIMLERCSITVRSYQPAAACQVAAAAALPVQLCCQARQPRHSGHQTQIHIHLCQGIVRGDMAEGEGETFNRDR